MMTKWIIDFPNGETGSYEEVDIFDTEEDARAWLLEEWGMPTDVADFFITRLET